MIAKIYEVKSTGYSMLPFTGEKWEGTEEMGNITCRKDTVAEG